VHGVWPLQGLQLRTTDLALDVMTEADLPDVASVLPEDVELDPSATTYAALDRADNRRAIMAQGYWRAFGTWSPQDWALPFVVRRRREVIGVQWLEGPGWGAERTVDSSSWLVPSARGQGLGRQARAAVLALAFGPLGALAAVSSAVVDNAASLGVSRALGYLPTHTSVLEHSGETLQHLRLQRADWAVSGFAHGVVVAGVAPALPFFGRGDLRDGGVGDERD